MVVGSRSCFVCSLLSFLFDISSVQHLGPITPHSARAAVAAGRLEADIDVAHDGTIHGSIFMYVCAIAVHVVIGTQTLHRICVHSAYKIRYAVIMAVITHRLCWPPRSPLGFPAGGSRGGALGLS